MPPRPAPRRSLAGVLLVALPLAAGWEDAAGELGDEAEWELSIERDGPRRGNPLVCPGALCRFGGSCQMRCDPVAPPGQQCPIPMCNRQSCGWSWDGRPPHCGPPLTPLPTPVPSPPPPPPPPSPPPSPPVPSPPFPPRPPPPPPPPSPPCPPPAPPALGSRSSGGGSRMGATSGDNSGSVLAPVISVAVGALIIASVVMWWRKRKQRLEDEEQRTEDNLGSSQPGGLIGQNGTLFRSGSGERAAWVGAEGSPAVDPPPRMESGWIDDRRVSDRRTSGLPLADRDCRSPSDGSRAGSQGGPMYGETIDTGDMGIDMHMGNGRGPTPTLRRRGDELYSNDPSQGTGGGASEEGTARDQASPGGPLPRLLDSPSGEHGTGGNNSLRKSIPGLSSLPSAARSESPGSGGTRNAGQQQQPVGASDLLGPDPGAQPSGNYPPYLPEPPAANPIVRPVYGGTPLLPDRGSGAV
eukprot:TRINITY_DN5238_c0_g1_i1.p1 TRINITY_DN5238_c0_g1~~TRINITY_DN5238_c0_g1_i1.p1  ORF type:complete len:498 (+),score=77.35 TRINITY_DN5238_c0_g1_i1:94-1494(+)